MSVVDAGAVGAAFWSVVGVRVCVFGVVVCLLLMLFCCCLCFGGVVCLFVCLFICLFVVDVVLSVAVRGIVAAV